MARWVNLDDCVEISVGEMNFYPVELLGDVYEEVAPVVHAHWIANRKDCEYTCSHCGDAWRGDFDLEPYDDHFYHCPNCGAKMDEEMSK